MQQVWSEQVYLVRLDLYGLERKMRVFFQWKDRVVEVHYPQSPFSKLGLDRVGSDNSLLATVLEAAQQKYLMLMVIAVKMNFQKHVFLSFLIFLPLSLLEVAGI